MKWLPSLLGPCVVLLASCSGGSTSGTGADADGGTDGGVDSSNPGPTIGLDCNGAAFRMSGSVGGETFDVTGMLTSTGQNNLSTPRTARIAYDSAQGKGYVNFTFGSPATAIVRIPSGTAVCANAVEGGTGGFSLSSFVAYQVSGTSGKCDPTTPVSGTVRGCSSY